MRAVTRHPLDFFQHRGLLSVLRKPFREELPKKSIPKVTCCYQPASLNQELERLVE